MYVRLLVLTLANYIACSQYGSFNANITSAVDAFTRISGFCSQRQNPLVSVCRAGAVAAQQADSLHREWISQNFRSLLKQTDLTIDVLLQLPTLSKYTITGILYSAMRDLKNLNSEMPLIWKGIELQTRRPFFLFVLSKVETVDVEGARVCLSDLSPLCIAVVVFDRANCTKNRMLSTTGMLSICHGLCCNPLLTPSFDELEKSDSTDIDIASISDLILNRKMKRQGEIWILERDWSRMSSTSSRLKIVIMRYKLVSLCVVMVYALLALFWFLSHSMDHRKDRAIALAFMNLTGLCLVFFCVA